MKSSKTLRSIDRIPDKVWEMAKAREIEIRRLVFNPPEKSARAEVIKKMGVELGVSHKHVYRLIKRYAADPRTESLVTRKDGPKGGDSKLDPRVEKIIEEQIEQTYLTMNKPSKAHLFLCVRRHCNAQQLQMPSRRTVERRLAAIAQREKVKRRLGARKAEELFGPIKGSLTADYPLHILQIDHTRADVLAVEAETMEVIGRPWISLAVDVFSRSYCGFRVSFDPPSVATVAACLTHAVMDKTAWLAERSLTEDWLAAGLPDVIHVDNGPEFHAQTFQRTCENYGIYLDYRPPGKPQFGGHIERRIQDLSKEIHLLEGTTFSNIRERGAYDSEGTARYTLREIEWLITTIIVEQNAKWHEDIGTSPNAKWKHGVAGKPLRMPNDMVTFLIDFLPSTERSVRRDGIHLFQLKYWHEALLPFLDNKHKVAVHYNPADLSKVYIRDRSGHYIEVWYKDLRHPPISLWELRAVKSAARKQGRLGVDEATIFRMAHEREEFRKSIRTKSRRARLELARTPRHGDGPRLISNAHAKLRELSNVDSDDDAPITLPYWEPERPE